MCRAATSTLRFPQSTSSETSIDVDVARAWHPHASAHQKLAPKETVMTTTSNLLGLFAATTLFAAGSALAQEMAHPAPGGEQQETQPQAQPEEQKQPAQQTQPQAQPEPQPVQEPAASEDTGTGSSAQVPVDADVAKDVENHLITLSGAIDSAQSALTQVSSLTSKEGQADTGSVRRSIDAVKDSLHTANVATDRLDDMKTLSGVANTQVNEIEKNLHDARNLAWKMGRESAMLRAPFTPGDAQRVNQMSSDVGKMLDQARVGVDKLAKIYNITLPQKGAAPVEEPAAPEKAPEKMPGSAL
jgi:hypothetical protein